MIKDELTRHGTLILRNDFGHRHQCWCFGPSKFPLVLRGGSSYIVYFDPPATREKFLCFVSQGNKPTTVYKGVGANYFFTREKAGCYFITTAVLQHTPPAQCGVRVWDKDEDTNATRTLNAKATRKQPSYEFYLCSGD